MEWTAKQAAGLAWRECDACDGKGWLNARGLAAGPEDEEGVPCACVYRRVFRACYRRFRACAEADVAVRIVNIMEVPRGVDRHLVWVRRNEDYCADFQAAGRRVLDPVHYRVFRFHHLLGAHPELVARRLQISRSAVYYAIEQIELAVGREFANMQPYSLYPPREYMKCHLGEAQPI